MSYDYSGRPTYDGRDDLERTRRLVEWNKRPGPRVGDFVQFLDGTRGRFTHDWHTEIQTTSRNPATLGDQSFYFGLGYVEFSGSLGAPIKKKRLRLVEGEQPEGRFWFFHHNNARAHNGVSFAVPCRLFEEIEKEEEEETKHMKPFSDMQRSELLRCIDKLDEEQNKFLDQLVQGPFVNFRFTDLRRWLDKDYNNVRSSVIPPHTEENVKLVESYLATCSQLRAAREERAFRRVYQGNEHRVKNR